MTFTPGKLACLVFLAVICAQTQAQQSARPKSSPTPIDDNDVIRINTNVVQVRGTAYTRSKSQNE